MIERIAHLYFTHTDDRDEDLPVSASERRPVSMARAAADPAAMFSRPEPKPAGATSAPAGVEADQTAVWTEKARAALRAETSEERLAAVAALAEVETGAPAGADADPAGEPDTPTTGASPWAAVAEVTTSG
jgi:hypothetical protein